MRQPKQTDTSGSKKTKLQRFEYREVQRSVIHEAPYNPRVISSIARKRLQKKIDQVGCVEPLVWNEKTGHLVSGHQRLSILDEAEGWPETDYIVGVSVVNLTEKQEKALNIFMNNGGAQGQFDKEKFFQMLPDLQLDDLGMSKLDLEFEFGRIPELDAMFAETRESADTIEAIQDIKERKKASKSKERNSASDDADYFVLLCFDSVNDKEAWLKRNRLSTETKMIHANDFGALVAPSPAGTPREVGEAASESVAATEEAKAVLQ